MLTWRIVSAPYYMWKEEHDRANAAEKKIADLEAAAQIVANKAESDNDRAKAMHAKRAIMAQDEIASALRALDPRNS